MFITSLLSVAIMLLYAVPGFILVKTKLVKAPSIAAFAVLLMYVAQPCLTVYTFLQAEYTTELLINIGIVAAVATVIMSVFIAISFLIFRKKYADTRYRIATIANAFGNCTFMGIPLLEALLPDNPEVVIYSTVFFIVMSILGWTVGSTLITQNKKYCKPLKALLNPAVLALVVALPLFFFKVQLPDILSNAVTIIGKFSTPLCMLILGMRLATVPIKSLFTDKIQYLSCIVKQLIMPLAALLILYWLPIDYSIKLSCFVMTCCPVAAVVLTFAEMLGDGQKCAANTVLLSTLSSVATMPLLLMLFQAIA